VVLQDCALHTNSAVYGGGVYIMSPKSCSVLDGCHTLEIDPLTEFVGNKALGGGGGGLFWKNAGLVHLTCVSWQDPSAARPSPCSTWINNSADGGYGPDIASPPYFLTPSTSILKSQASGSIISAFNLTLKVGFSLFIWILCCLSCCSVLLLTPNKSRHILPTPRQ
jgi:hypothetical protein